MSLAILPSSPMTYSQAPMPTLLPSAPSPSKRPKLSLNTSTTPQVFGKGSTSLRLETLSATSPTGRNTFRNGYGQDQAKPRRPTLTSLATIQTQTPSTPSRSLTPLVTSVAPAASQPATPLSVDLESSEESSSDVTSSSAASITSTSTLDSLSGVVPYQLAYNITSILSNGPIPRTRANKTSFAQSRPMFPAPKKVTFRAPLTEDIQTSKYTMAHSDINSSSSTISTLELPPPVQPRVEETKLEATRDDETGNVQHDGAIAKDVQPTSPRTGEKRESSDEEDSDTCPATPVAGRRKKSRQWRWTLGPVGSEEGSTSKEEWSEDEGEKEAKTDGA